MFSRIVTKYLVSNVDAIVADQTFWAIVMNRIQRVGASNEHGRPTLIGLAINSYTLIALVCCLWFALLYLIDLSLLGFHLGNDVLC